MKAEILTIGDEILIGQITNTNSVWIAQQLNLIGVQVSQMSTVGDDVNAINHALLLAFTRAEIVLITGGLGPTKDDITKKVFADFFGVPLVEDKIVLADVTDYFAKRGRELNPINRAQAMVPEGCRIIKNHNGTAPGMWMQKDGVHFISMPGVPYEMQGMMTEYILPAFKKEFHLPVIYHKTVLTQGIGESAIAEIVNDWEDALVNKNIRLAYLPQPGMVKLRLSTIGRDASELRDNVEKEIDQLIQLLEKYIFGYETYGEDPPSLQKIVSDILREKKKTLSLAESCTGGYLSSLFAAVPGASEILKGSIVPYSNEAKQKLVNVDATVFKEHGAVSSECVKQLASKVREKFGSDYAISISGIAGPTGGTDEKPVGTVWIAVASADKVLPLKFQFGDNRHRNIVSAAHAATNMLRKLILKEV